METDVTALPTSRHPAVLVFDSFGLLLHRFRDSHAAGLALEVGREYISCTCKNGGTPPLLVQSKDGKVYRFECEKTWSPEGLIAGSWKRCRGYPCYDVSDLGFIRDHRTHGIIRAWGVDGYLCVRVFEDGLPQLQFVHDLVACTWLGFPADDKIQIGHRDDDRCNNSVENLEWTTAPEDRPLAPPKTSNIAPENDYPYRVTVEQLDASYRVLRRFPTMGEAARSQNISANGIRNAIHSKRQWYGGFVWRRVAREPALV